MVPARGSPYTPGVRLVLLLLAVSFGLGLLLGGSFKNLAELKLRYWGLALAGYALQVLPYPESWGRDVPIAMLLVSFVLLLAFAMANLRQPGVPLIVLGVLLNFIVIAANWGMPVSARALINSDQADVLRELELAPGQKHHLANGTDHFRFLGDVIPIPDPIHITLSVGDLILYAGVGVLLVVRMRTADPLGRPDRPSPESTTDGTRP
jgi:hypothetical protein